MPPDSGSAAPQPAYAFPKLDLPSKYQFSPDPIEVAGSVTFQFFVPDGWRVVRTEAGAAFLGRNIPGTIVLRAPPSRAWDRRTAW